MYGKISWRDIDINSDLFLPFGYSFSGILRKMKYTPCRIEAGRNKKIFPKLVDRSKYTTMVQFPRIIEVTNALDFANKIRNSLMLLPMCNILHFTRIIPKSSTKIFNLLINSGISLIEILFELKYMKINRNIVIINNQTEFVCLC